MRVGRLGSGVAALVVTAALAGCDSRDAGAADEKTAKLSIAIGDDTAGNAAAATTAGKPGTVSIAGDTDTGKFELKLPGGLAAKVSIPERLAKDARFDIDGVGLYPGAKVTSVDVDAAAAAPLVRIGFAAPADAAAVADWYQRGLEARRHQVARRGETLSGTTADGDSFTLALTPAAAGSRGLLTLRDRSPG